ncbi:MAG: TenA family protein [Wolbachia sp.]
MTKLSETVWRKSKHVYQDIINQPFNQELMNGTLSRERFCYYIEQESFYLTNYANALAMIAARSRNVEHIEHFLEASLDAIDEQQTFNSLLKKEFNFKETGNLTLAILAYTSYLRYISAVEPLEVTVAAVLPCFWVYKEVGLHIAKNSIYNNPFASWIRNYSSEKFALGMKKTIDIFDNISEQVTKSVRQQMCDTFHKCVVLEWHFWHDTYEMRIFDNYKRQDLI